MEFGIIPPLWHTEVYPPDERSDLNVTAVKKPIEELLEIMSMLRGPEGCPWDREQTHESLKPYVVEEAYPLDRPGTPSERITGRIETWHSS